MSALKKGVTAGAIVILVGGCYKVWNWKQGSKRAKEKDEKQRMMNLVSGLGANAVTSLPGYGSATRMATVQDETETIKVTVTVERRRNGGCSEIVTESFGQNIEQGRGSIPVTKTFRDSVVQTEALNEEAGVGTEDYRGELPTRTNSGASRAQDNASATMDNSDTANECQDGVVENENATEEESNDSQDDGGVAATSSNSEASIGQADVDTCIEDTSGVRRKSVQTVDSNEETNISMQDTEMSSITVRTNSGASEDLSICVDESAGIDDNDNDDSTFVIAPMEATRMLLVGMKKLGYMSEDEMFRISTIMTNGGTEFINLDIVTVRALAVDDKLPMDTWKAWYALAKVHFSMWSPKRGKTSFVRESFEKFVAKCKELSNGSR